MTIDNLFPKTKFVEEWIQKYGLEKAYTKQLEVVAGELFEASQAYHSGDLIHAKEEVIDVMHSAHQLQYMNSLYRIGDADMISADVRKKNEERKYYVWQQK